MSASGRTSIQIQNDVVIDGVIDIRTVQFDELTNAIEAVAPTLQATDLGVVTQRESTDLVMRAATGTIASQGTTDVITPTEGMKVRVFWVLAVPDPENTDGRAPLVTVQFSGATGAIYKGYALGHWQVFQGVTNEKVQIVTDASDTVAYTIHYQEVA